MVVFSLFVLYRCSSGCQHIYSHYKAYNRKPAAHIDRQAGNHEGNDYLKPVRGLFMNEIASMYDHRY